jgi:hypothetical protein
MQAEDLHAHERVPFYDGYAASLRRQDLYFFIRRQINSLFSLKVEAEFPSSRPTVLSHNNFNKIREAIRADPQAIRITEKTDGKRFYLCFGARNFQRRYIAVVDSQYNVHLIKMKGRAAFYENTILDGEMVQDVEQKGKEKHFVFYVFDCLQACGVPVHKNRFSDRLEMAKIVVNHLAPSDDPHWTTPFQVRVKEFFLARDLPSLLRKPLAHPCDGLIINEEQTATCYHCPHTHKWKAFKHITIDFLVLVKDTEFWLYTTGRDSPCFRQQVSSTLENCTEAEKSCERAVSVLSGHLDWKVAEFFYCPHHKLWKPKRLRGDKTHANSFHVLGETIEIMKVQIPLHSLIQSFTA